MALKIHSTVPTSLHNHNPFQINPFPARAHFKNPIPKLQFSISCSKDSSKFTDSELTTKFTKEVDKINAQKLQREHALTKSRELLFKELCNHMGLENEQVLKKWKRMNEDDKWVLVKGFVSKWGSHFHPLSERSVKEFVDEYAFVEETESDDDEADGSASSSLFPSLKKLMGFSQNSQG